MVIASTWIGNYEDALMQGLGAGYYSRRGVHSMAGFLLLQNRHFRHPWRSEPVA
ncbi:hypothetical protein GCM10007392_36560 [Saccharospirillum salsuginis]|uniref:Uncharacterized protein n=1 Tax=Saccharospirillum salsuginis TaxID=418750 RepID=A0A918NEX8_9GAMM|nr:hypothetical protein GCM10007392_36560 [Saccharospirillum salsuginis]